MPKPFQTELSDSFANMGVKLGKLTASSEVVAGIKAGASESGTRFDDLLATAKIESGLRAGARAGSSSASGLFQFVEQTWLGAVKRSGAEHGLSAQAAAITRGPGGYAVSDPAMKREILALRDDPKVAAAMAGDHMRDLSETLTASLGRQPDVSETYLGHFLGAGGATQMLRAMRDTPMRAASDVLPDAARANPAMFDDQTVAQFVQKVRGRVGQAYADLGLAMPKGAVQMPARAAAVDRADGSTPDTSFDGWGKGGPTRLSTTPERVMLSSLTQVFTKLDRSSAAQKKGGAGQVPLGAMLGMAGGADGRG